MPSKKHFKDSSIELKNGWKLKLEFVAYDPQSSYGLSLGFKYIDEVKFFKDFGIDNKTFIKILNFFKNIIETFGIPQVGISVDCSEDVSVIIQDIHFYQDENKNIIKIRLIDES